jgi:uncharacterized protein (TIGR02246 family)
VWLAFITQFQGGKIVKQRMTGAIVGAILVALSMMSFGSPARADDRAEIRALEERFVAAMKAKDLDAIMKVYAPGQTLFVFDVIPPRQYVGAAAYRKDWQTFLDSFEGPITVELSDLDVAADRNLAFSHSIQRVAGTDKQGKKLDLTVRVTDVYKKARGRWLIIHEHVSVPVDLDTDKPDLNSKP